MRGGLATVAACCALVALLAGCGGDTSGNRGDTASPAAATAPGTQTQARPDLSDPNIEIHTGRRLAPNPWREPGSIKPHPHADVRRLIVHDVAQGQGPERVRAGDYVFIDFIVASYDRGLMFNRAWKHQQPYSTAGTILAPRGELRGLVLGMRGMRRGGRRQIIVPAKLNTGMDADHPDYHRPSYWDVVLRGFYARGCDEDGEPCQSGP